MEPVERLVNASEHTFYGPGLGWLPALPIHYELAYSTLPARIRDAWAVFRCRATAVQWPHQRRHKEAPRG